MQNTKNNNKELIYANDHFLLRGNERGTKGRNMYDSETVSQVVVTSFPIDQNSSTTLLFLCPIFFYFEKNY